MCRCVFTGQTELMHCFKVASQPAVRDVLEAWDVAETERLLQKLEIEREKRREANRKRMEAEKNK